VTDESRAGSGGGPGSPPGPPDSSTKVPSLVEAQAAAIAEARRLREQRAQTPAAATPPTPAPPRARVPTLVEADAVHESLLARHHKVYPRLVTGVFANLRVAFVALTLGLYYILPWFNWGTGRQAFLIDLPGRKFEFFAWTFWPQDLIYLTAILILAALALFFFTTILGRVWCGFTCPQTVWTEVFLWIERQIDGDRMKQIKLAQGPWTATKLGKRFAKHTVWILFSLWTGFTFVGFFTPIRELAVAAVRFDFSAWEAFWVFFYGFATYGNAGWLREQVCIYMCPYARFQGVMFDRNTLIISYNDQRGEPRGSRSRKSDPRAQQLGHCIDCTLCVQVCPTGIDIRQGQQYQCIACAACVDVCDSVMEKMKYPKGLIGYTTLNTLEGRPEKLLRPRVLLYAGLLTSITLALVVSVLLRVPLGLDIIRDRGSLYRDTADGRIENVYTLKVLNMDHVAHEYRLLARGIDDIEVAMDTKAISIGAAEVREVAVRLQVNPAALTQRSTKIVLRLEALDDPSLVVEEGTRFLGPF